VACFVDERVDDVTGGGTHTRLGWFWRLIVAVDGRGALKRCSGATVATLTRWQ